MIRHIVLTRYAPGTPEADIAAIHAGLAGLVDSLPGAQAFTGGRSASPEQLERGYRHGFVIDFDSWANLAAYADHPTHRHWAAQIVAHAQGGLDGVIVLDIEV